LGNLEKGEKGKDADGGGDNEFMATFFQDVGVVKNTMGNIRRNIKQIEEKYVQSLNSITIDQGSSILILFCTLLHVIGACACMCNREDIVV
jgi:hypothetical protein